MFTLTVTPRLGEIDGLGHVNNTVPALWFELARNPVFKIFAPDLNFTPETWSLIMAHSEYDFILPLYLPHNVEIRTYISHIGNKSFTAAHEAWQEGRLCVKGSVVLVHYDFTQNKTTPIPDDKRKLLEEHLQTSVE